MPRSLAALLLVVGMLGTAILPARAAPPGSAVVEEARGLVRAGNKLFEQKRYDEALARFRRAFEIRPTPNTALNLALTHQALKNFDEALTYARRYLELAPDAKDRGEIKKLIRQLEKERARAARAPAPPAAVPAAPASPTEAPPAPAPASPTPLTPPTPVAAVTPPPASSATAPTAAVAVETGTGASAAPSSTPWYRRWYVWAGAAVVVGAVVAGSVAGTRSASIPSTEFGHQTITLRGP